MINYRLVILIIGVLLIIESAFLGLSVVVSAIYGENDFFALLISAIIALLIGGTLYYINRNTKKDLAKREAYLIVTSGWLVLSFFGALPFFISRYIPSYTDAFFETISGFTATGASILNNIEDLPHGLLFWRSITQWLGGMGIIVLYIAVISMIKVGGFHLFAAEVSGLKADKISPKISETAKKLWLLYLFLTLVETFLLYLGGMNFFDAINHSFTTMATGGFSTKQDSIAYWNSPFIHYVIIFFMILGSTNFTLIYWAFKGKFKKLFTNSEVKFYILLIIFSTFIVFLGLIFFNDRSIEEAFRKSLFQVVSIISTTGYVIDDFYIWQPNGMWWLLLILMLFGGCSGSTAGAIKIVRVYVLFRNSLTEFKRILIPHAVLPVRYNKTAISNQIISSVLAFFFIYIFIVFLGTLILSFTGLDFISSLGAMATSLGGVGPGLGVVGPSLSYSEINIFAKWFLTFIMLLGRLEIFTVLIIFTPYFWKR